MTGAAPRLSLKTLARARSGVAVPDYDPARIRIGVVHLGPGGFFRAHVAWHFDRLLARDPRWGIAAVSLKSGRTTAALAAQDGLYTLVELATPHRYRIIGAVRECLGPSDGAAAIFRRLIDPAVRLVTLTVTEKGYCLRGDGVLDLDHPDIRHDLADLAMPSSAAGWILQALMLRRRAGASPFTVVSCDNIPGNGPLLRAAVIRLAEARGESALAHWIGADVGFPATMVDSITPHMTEALEREVAEATGLADLAPIARESFTQWVIADALGPDAPDLASAGAIIVPDVSPYSAAKLRLLNAAHSALAYRGLRAGYDTVDAAMGDTTLAAFVEAMMRDEIVPTLAPDPRLDLDRYIDAVLLRFRSRAIKHELAKIAEDGSVKLPLRYAASLETALKSGGPFARMAAVFAAWFGFIVDAARAGRALDDPRAAALAAIGEACTGDAKADVARFLSLGDVFPASVRSDERFVAALERAYADCGLAQAGQDNREVPPC